MSWRLTLLACSSVGILATPLKRDLDVGIPPGSPTSWAARFPSVTPSGPLFPKTGHGQVISERFGEKPKKSKAPPRRRGTIARTEKVDVEVHIESTLGVIRVITWDLLGHLPWAARPKPKRKSGPTTGRGSTVGDLPFVNDGLYWANMSALLRLLMHPQLVSKKELICHLVEIGEPALAVLDAAMEEDSLRRPCQLIKKMITADRAVATPLPGKTPRETMMKRFLAEELMRSYPHDPEGGFGRLFLLWSAEMEPYVSEYVTHEDSLLRRNAIAALGKYRTDSAMQTLADLAATTEDPVALMRSLSAVGAYQSLRKPGGILERLQKTKDEIEQIALVVAVGRAQMEGAIPTLLKLGKRMNDSDLLMAVVAALVRIRQLGEKGEVLKFARKVARTAKAVPKRFQVERAGQKPDIPDTRETRGIAIEQLARLLLARILPGDAEAEGNVLSMASEGDRGKAGARGGSRGRRAPTYPNLSTRKVLAPVKMLFLEVVAELGEAGTEAILKVVDDRSSEPGLRGYALSRVPYTERGSKAVAILDDAEETDEMKVYAIEVLDKDGHARLKEISLDLLEKCGEAEVDKATPEKRYLWLQAVRALSKRGQAKTEDILPLLKHAEAKKVTLDEVKRRIRNLVLLLVDEAAAGSSRRSHRVAIEEILELAIRNNINKRITNHNREEARAKIDQYMPELKGHKGDLRYKQNVSSAILRYVLGYKMGLDLKSRMTFKPVVLLEEEILFALGRTRTEEAADALAKFLADHEDSPLRAHACLGLAMTGQSKVAHILVPALSDRDGFTRFCAYEGLRQLLDREIWADWIYGLESEREKAAKIYASWLKGH